MSGVANFMFSYMGVDSLFLIGVRVQDRMLAEQCYRESGGQMDMAIVELLQLMTLLESDGMQCRNQLAWDCMGL